MDADKLNQLADTAVSLAGRVLTVPAGAPYGEWFNEFRGLLEGYFPAGHVEPTLADALDTKSRGLLTLHSEWLASRRSLTHDTRPMTRDKLTVVAAVLRSAATAPAPAAPGAPPLRRRRSRTSIVLGTGGSSTSRWDEAGKGAWFSFGTRSDFYVVPSSVHVVIKR